MQTQNIVRVVLWMTGTLLSFSMMAISIRLLAGRLSIFEILTLRTFGALVILSTLLVVQAVAAARHTHQAAADASFCAASCISSDNIAGRWR